MTDAKRAVGSASQLERVGRGISSYQQGVVARTETSFWTAPSEGAVAVTLYGVEPGLPHANLKGSPDHMSTSSLERAARRGSRFQSCTGR